MKKITLFTLLALLTMTSCQKFLEEKNYTNLDVGFIYDTPDGLYTASTALYPLARQIHRLGEGTEGALATTAMYGGDDISFVRAGGGNWQIAWYDATKLTSQHGDIEGFWSYNYQIIGKANEIIFYGSKMDQNNPKVKSAMGQAYGFRAKAYFDLLRRYDNIFWNDVVTTPDNVDKAQTERKPDTQAFMLSKIKNDLDQAISRLDWTTPDIGRFTQMVARHLKLMVCMWPVNGQYAAADLNEAIAQVEAIEGQKGTYSLMDEPKDVFTPTMPMTLVSAKINNRENIFVEQWSNETGGGATSNAGVRSGHRFASSFLAGYHQAAAAGSMTKLDLEQGGTSWARIFPNEYLLSLYDKAKDKRYTQYFNHFWRFNNLTGPTKVKIQITQDILDLAAAGADLAFTIPAGTTAGTTIEIEYKNGDIVPRVISTNYAMYLSPSSTKHFDKWTRDVSTNPSFKDIVIYRVAESYLLGAEAYLRKGDQGRAKYFFNKTWMRAGNEERTADLTLDDILDEDARELSQEGYGHRWYTLKRFGYAVMKRQITNYSGSKNMLNQFSWTKTTGAISKPAANITNYNNYFSVRQNFANGELEGGTDNKYMRWPIPYSQILSMGGNYPQNDGYIN